MIGFPPRTPFLISFEQEGGSALCGARPGALPLDPATFEKVDETSKRASRAERAAKRAGQSVSVTNTSRQRALAFWAAASALSRSGNRPYTAEPEPLITAPSAP